MMLKGSPIMNGYMDAITNPILDANGMVIKYIGDDQCIYIMHHR